MNASVHSMDPKPDISSVDPKPDISSVLGVATRTPICKKKLLAYDGRHLRAMYAIVTSTVEC